MEKNDFERLKSSNGKKRNDFVANLIDRVMTGDEKWVLYDNPKRRKPWEIPRHVSTPTAKPNIHGANVILCMWQDHLSVVYYELLKLSEIITGNRYRMQLLRLSRALKEKRLQYQERLDKIILQHDNTRPHVASPSRHTWKR